MIFPQQMVLPLAIPGESQDIIKEDIPDLGPLHLHICRGIEFTTKHQLPIVKPECIDIPDDIKAFYRLKKSSKQNLKDTVAHFYTQDSNFEQVWKKPHAYIEIFRRYKAILSTDYSILSNMVEIQRFWNDFRNKLLAAFYQKWNVPVIASPSWSDDLHNIERYMEGWPHNSIIAINSTGVCHDKKARHTWLDGYWAMMDILNPSHILRYGGFIEGENVEISTYYVNNNRR